MLFFLYPSNFHASLVTSYYLFSSILVCMLLFMSCYNYCVVYRSCLSFWSSRDQDYICLKPRQEPTGKPLLDTASYLFYLIFSPLTFKKLDQVLKQQLL